jgi:hypothetical protein
MSYKTFSEAFQAVKDKFPQKDLTPVPVAMWETIYSICERESFETVAELQYDYSFRGAMFRYGYKVVYIKPTIK